MYKPRMEQQVKCCPHLEQDAYLGLERNRRYAQSETDKAFHSQLPQPSSDGKFSAGATSDLRHLQPLLPPGGKGILYAARSSELQSGHPHTDQPKSLKCFNRNHSVATKCRSWQGLYEITENKCTLCVGGGNACTHARGVQSRDTSGRGIRKGFVQEMASTHFRCLDALAVCLLKDTQQSLNGL